MSDLQDVLDVKLNTTLNALKIGILHMYRSNRYDFGIEITDENIDKIVYDVAEHYLIHVRYQKRQGDNIDVTKAIAHAYTIYFNKIVP